MARDRILSKYPCYNGCIPFTGYFVQRLKKGMFLNKWVDVKGFDTLERAKQLLEILQQFNHYKNFRYAIRGMDFDEKEE